jgi:hypothetical protein
MKEAAGIAKPILQSSVSDQPFKYEEIDALNQCFQDCEP